MVLKNPDLRPAPADDRLAFTLDPQPAVPAAAAAWAGAVWLTGEGRPALIAAGGREVRLSTGATLPFPGGPSAVPPGPYGVVAADLNYDFRVDLILAGAGGVRIYRQSAQGGFTDVTTAAKLPAAVTNGALYGAWVADVDTEGDLDIVLAPQDGAAVLLRNNGDGSFVTQAPFAGALRVRDFAWADLDGDGVPDAAVVDDRGTVRTYLNLRGGAFRERAVPSAFAGIAAIAPVEVTGDQVIDLVGVTTSGSVVRLSSAANGGAAWDAAEIARVEVPAGFAPGSARLTVGDIDNNGAPDVVIAGRIGIAGLLGTTGTAFRLLGAALPLAVSAAADLDGNGRLDLVGTADGGARVARGPRHAAAITGR